MVDRPRFSRDFNQAIRFDSTTPRGHTNRGLCYRSLKRYEKALSDFENALEINPNDSHVMVRIADAFHKMGQEADAISFYEQALAVSKDDKLVIQEKLTHQDIANMVGSSREMVSRVMKELTVGEYITVTKKIIQINKKLPYNW